jgi:hypothetical protein
MSKKDWTGNKNSIFKTLGASNHTDKEREVNDYYATDPIAAQLLMQNEKLHKDIWECACGGGHLSKEFEKAGYNVKSTDLIYRGYGQGGVDFLEQTEQFTGDIITNPPYKLAYEFIEKGMELITEGNKVCMFLKLQFLEGKKRKELFKKYPLKTLYVSSSRILCAKNGEFEKMKAGGGSAVAYGWYVFEKGYKGEPTIKWIN